MYDYAFMYHHYATQRPRIIATYARALQRGECITLATPPLWGTGASRGVALAISADLNAAGVAHTWQVTRTCHIEFREQ
jgi:hypothetical protein